MDIFSHDFTISDADFHRLVQFIQQNYGIDLSKKRQLISSRLSHSLRELGYKDFRTFLEHLFSTRDPADLELVLNKLTTNYTFFLREQDHFAYFQDKILPELSAKASAGPGALHLERWLLQRRRALHAFHLS